MKTYYTDSSFDYKSTDKTSENVVRGKIAVVGKGFERVEKVVIGKVPELKQYNNILELTTIGRAVEIASEDKDETNSLAIYTDSKIAMYWARAGKIKSGVLTKAHANALDYLRMARRQFGGIVTFNYIPRDENPAGHLLAEELKKESPHTK